MPDLPATLVVCPRGVGKTTLAQLLHKLFGIPAVICSDSSSILDLHMQRKTEVGLKLLEIQKQRESGKLFPCDLVCKGLFDWLECMRKQQNVTHVILAGSPRSEPQAQAWLGYTKNLRVVHITANREHVLAGVRARQLKSGKIRPDESEDAINEAWDQYEKVVVPGLKTLNGRVLELHRDEPMRKRLEKTLNHIVVPDPLRKRLIAKLSNRHHPVSKEVDILDEHHITAAKAAVGQKKPENKGRQFALAA